MARDSSNLSPPTMINKGVDRDCQLLLFLKYDRFQTSLLNDENYGCGR
jgi:hypothetical protein